MEEKIEQRRKIKKLEAESELLLEEPAFLVSSEWFSTFRDIISYDDEKINPKDEVIPEIDNNSLLNNGRLRNDLVEGQDFVVLTKNVWEELESYYGGGPEVTAMVVYCPVSKRNVVVYRKIAISIIFGSETRSFAVTQYNSVFSLKQKVCQSFKQDYEEMELCEFFNGEFGETFEDEKLLIEYSVTNGQKLVLVNKKDLKHDEVREMKPILKHRVRNGGLCGLENLGNTCFFNSAVQCLLHTDMLTNYFLETDWTKEISTTNPLGTKGALSTAYFKLLESVYSGNYKIIAPAQMRKTLIRFAPHFGGYSQQDAQELLLFMLDGIHEDLNRIKKKPYLENAEGDGKNDAEVSKVAWSRYKMRNDSIIVDLFHGQLKSHIRCPNCRGETVVFDPYASISLPVPQKAKRTTKFLFVPADPLQKQKEMSFIIKSNWTTASTNRYIDSIEERHVDTVYSRVTPDSANISFFTAINIPESTKNIVICELPDRSHLYCPAFLCVTERGYIFNSELVISGPYLMDIPSVFTTEEMLQKQAEKYFSFLWDKENPDEDEVYAKFDKRRKDFQPFKEGKKKLSVEIQTSMWENNKTFMPFTRMPWITKRTVKVHINPTFMTKKEGFKWTRFYRKTAVFDEPASTTNDYSTLDSCFTNFAADIDLDEDNKWYCPKCKKFVCANKKMDVWSVPENLIIHLKRFKQIGSMFYKTDVMVNYPLELDMAPYIAGPHEEKVIYKLYAVVEHHGGMGFGHYTAHAVVNNEWYLFNDSSVSKSNCPINSAAYVLFYKKQH